MRGLIRRFWYEEDGHLYRAATSVLGAAGAIVLAIGATSDNDAVVSVGAIVVALAFLNAGLVEHVKMDYPLFRRLDEIEQR